MTEPDTPESLLEFFQMLAPDEREEPAACEIHYGCACVLRKGLAAARMLMEARPGGPAMAAVPAEDGAPESAPAETLNEDLARAAQLVVDMDKALKEARESETAQAASLTAEKTRAEGLLKQNMKLANETMELKQKIHSLQKQVNRLYDTMHMKEIHTTIRKEAAPVPASPAAEAAAPVPIESKAPPAEPEMPAAPAEPDPPPAPAEKPTPSAPAKPQTLEEELWQDSAARVPREPPPTPKAPAPGESGEGTKGT